MFDNQNCYAKLMETTQKSPKILLQKFKMANLSWFVAVSIMKGVVSKLVYSKEIKNKQSDKAQAVLA